VPEFARRLNGPAGRPLRVAHLTTVDMSLALLLGTELQVDVDAGLDVFGISAPGPYVERITEIGVTHVPITSLTRSWDLRRDAKAVRDLVRVLRELRLDVLHTHNPKTGVFGRIVGQRVDIPVVVNTCHGLWAGADDPVRKRALVYGAEAVAARFSDAELFQNGEDMRTLRKALRRGQSRVVGNGVDLDRFAFDVEGRNRVRAELGVAPSEVLVGGVGRRVAEKGIREFAAAAKALAGRAAFVWIGPVDMEKPDALAEDLAGVHFVGERSDMPAVYSAFDIFVLPSYREGFSRSGMEAAACGRPMVLSDIRGCREVGTHEEHLLLTPAADAESLTAAINRLLTDAALRERLGIAARDRASQRFNQRRIAAVSIETYADVARRKGLGWQEGCRAAS
jgi:glycosyltransferase involved in cell wall biosynthesis